MSSNLQVFYSVFSGLLLALGIPNELFLLGNPFYAFISLIPYYIAIKHCKSYRQAFLLGFLQSITTHLCSSFWLAYFKDFAIFTLGASALGTAAQGGIMALFMYLPFSRKENNEDSLLKPFYKHSAFRILYFTCMYTLYEWVKSTGFIGYPWGTVSSAMYRWHSLTQIAAITGTYGITFLTVLFDSITAEAFENYYHSFRILGSNARIEDRLPFFESTFNMARVFALLFTITLLWGSYEYNKPRTPDKTLTTVLVQQNCDPWQLDSDDETVTNSINLSQEKIDELDKLGKKAQLVVWSEGSLIRTLPGALDYYEWEPQPLSLSDFISKNKVPLLTGATYKKNIYDENHENILSTKYFNAAAMFDSEANFRGFYGKLHLVPFAESIPGIDNPIIKTLFSKVVGISAGWTQGEQLTYFELPASYYNLATIPRVNNINISIPYDITENQKEPLVRIASPICFDDAFTDVIRPMFLNGAELFINLTDDSWSRKKSSEYQHFCIASYRAIEYRSTFVRSTNAGYSAVISPNGSILADQPLFEESSLGVEVPVYKRVITPYARFGNWLPYTCIVIFFLVCILMFSSFTYNDYIPSERKKPLKLKKKKNKKKHKK